MLNASPGQRRERKKNGRGTCFNFDCNEVAHTFDSLLKCNFRSKQSDAVLGRTISSVLHRPQTPMNSALGLDGRLRKKTQLRLFSFKAMCLLI